MSIELNNSDDDVPAEGYGPQDAPVRLQEPWGAPWICRSNGEDDPELAHGAVPEPAIDAFGVRRLAAEAAAWFLTTQEPSDREGNALYFQAVGEATSWAEVERLLHAEKAKEAVGAGQGAVGKTGDEAEAALSGASGIAGANLPPSTARNGNDYGRARVACWPGAPELCAASAAGVRGYILGGHSFARARRRYARLKRRWTAWLATQEERVGFFQQRWAAADGEGDKGWCRMPDFLS